MLCVYAVRNMHVCEICSHEGMCHSCFLSAMKFSYFDPGFVYVLPDYSRFSFKHDSVLVSIALTMSQIRCLIFLLFQTRNLSLTVQMRKGAVEASLGVGP